MTAFGFVLHVLAVTLIVYGLSDSRLLRAYRIRVYQVAYTRAGADLNDETWESIRANPFEWDRFVHADDDPPKLAVLAVCHWCTGFYASAVWTTLWAIEGSVDNAYLIATVGLAAVPVEVFVLAVITRLSQS